MVSDDTRDRTQEMLEQEKWFGMGKGQVTLMKQEKVAAIQVRRSVRGHVRPENAAALTWRPAYPLYVNRTMQRAYLGVKRTCHIYTYFDDVFDFCSPSSCVSVGCLIRDPAD